MIKVLYLPLGNQIGMIDAWNKIDNLQLTVYDYMAEISKRKNIQTIRSDFINLVSKEKPDLIHIQQQHDVIIDKETAAKAKQIVPHVKLTVWTGDVRDQPQAGIMALSSIADYCLISSVGQLEMYKNSGCKNIAYWQVGYNPKQSYHSDDINNFKYDIMFIGNNYGNTFPGSKLRTEVVNVLKDKYKNKFAVFGSGYRESKPIDPWYVNSYYHQSLLALNISHYNNISHYFSDRLLSCLASGRPTISWHFPGFESYFVDRGDIFIASSIDDIINCIEFCKANVSEANRVGRNGYLKVLAEHTFYSRIKELLGILKLGDKL